MVDRMAGAMSKWRGFDRATKSARACYSQVINVRFRPAAASQLRRRGLVGRLRPWRTADGNGPAVTTPPPPSYPQPAQHLRNAATRLAAELDDVHLYRAAAYASMVVDAINQSGGEPEPDGDMRTDVDLDFELDEHGRVWMIREGDCHIIGRRNAVCAEMRRFLRTVVLGEEP
jgi:hypothetical protein